MADTALSNLTAITTPASGDLILVTDVSDTTDSAAGSSRRITYTNFVGGILGELAITSSVAELNLLDGITVLSGSNTGDEVVANLTVSRII